MTPKAELHPKRHLLRIWRGQHGVIHFELLQRNQTITADFYSNQLQRLCEELRKKRSRLIYQKGVIHQHDNARPHVAKLIKDKIKELGWKTLFHPPYSPNLAPSDYHLFQSLQHHLADSRHENLRHNLAAKPVDLYERGIDLRPERWAKVIEHNGQYLIEILWCLLKINNKVTVPQSVRT